MRVGTFLLTLGLILTTFALYPTEMAARANPVPRWTLVQVDSLCFGGQRDGERSYLYNVDQNADGVVDFAVWFHETDLVVFWIGSGGERGYPRPFLLTESGRSLHQWAFAWFGYRATGACNLNGGIGNWEIRPSPRSIYASGRYLQLGVQFGVRDGATFGIRCAPLSACGNEQYSLTTEYWSATSSVWFRDNRPHDGFSGWIEFFKGWGWSYSSTDWATLVQQGGHPPYPLQYTLATSNVVPSQSECVYALPYPHGQLDVRDMDGRFNAAGYGRLGELRQLFFWDECWIIVNGPTAAFTYSPALPMVGQTVTFDGSRSADPDGSISSYSWNFGDGVVARGSAVVSHTYSSVGSYSVSLTVTDSTGLTDTSRAQVTVATPANIAPIYVTLGGSPQAGAQVTIRNSGGTVVYSAYTDGNGMVPGRTGLASGTYTVSASWRDMSGCPDYGYLWVGSLQVTIPPNQSPTVALTMRHIIYCPL